MTGQAPYGVNIFGDPEDADLPELVHLGRAVEIGGEGGSLTLLGPVEGQRGEFMIVRQELLDLDEEGVTSGGATLEPAGTDLIAALDQFQPHWRQMVGVYVAPHLEARIQAELEGGLAPSRRYDDWRQRFTEAPMLCRALYRGSTMWPDEHPRDAFWLEGNVDQARAVLSRLPLDHQEQLQRHANKPFAVVVSRDGTQRYAMPHIEGTPEDPWPPDMFERLNPFPVEDIAHLAFACPAPEEHPHDPLPEVLNFRAAQAHYETLRARYSLEERNRALWEMAQVTWPIRVIFTEREGRDTYLIMRVLGHGMEDELWSVGGEENDREAVKLSIIMRNLLFLGNDDAHPEGYDWFLRYAVPQVREINRLANEEGRTN